MKLLTDEEYNEKTEELELIEEKEYGKYFLGDMAFLMNVDDSIRELGDLL